MRVVAEGLTDLVLELRHVPTIPRAHKMLTLVFVGSWLAWFCAFIHVLTLECGRDRESSRWISLLEPCLRGP